MYAKAPESVNSLADQVGRAYSRRHFKRLTLNLGRVIQLQLP